MAAEIGSILAARYQLVAPLGEGGMGRVWSATHLLTGRAVAIKQLWLGAPGRSARDARARFLLEAQSACAVEHPNVVQVFDFVEDGSEPPFLVMELLRGETLANKLAREPSLSLEETARLVVPLVSAVGTAHARGIVHRDLKPSNIFLCEQAQPGERGGGRPLVKVLDFGIAKWLQGNRLEPGLHTQTGSTLGTPSYMSPEQATAERGVDHRTDIWSIGVILYECLSGARPVEGENAAQMVMRLLSSGIIPIEHLVPSLPEPLTRLVGRMLAREPRERPQDLEELFELLSGISGEHAPRFGKPQLASAAPEESAPPGALRQELSGSAPETTWVPATRPPASEPDSQAPIRARQGGRWPWVALPLVALLLGALWWRPRPVPAPAQEPPVNVAVAAPEPVPALAAAATLPAPAPALPEPAALAEPAAPPVAEPSLVPALSTAAASVPRRATRAAGPAPPVRSAAKPAVAPGAGAQPRGAECERSSQCASRACVAFACQ